ncbi:glycoside hydrolase family 3 protein [Naematelia encephala]|uniref:beta-glucosidase n=1 Tax=Naematelia encephala TaxID=71784 RepID=A0A1Y2BKL3_9TREE|nr:glycoside hydrolase family 3 protein [Naematelia encephala]
MTSLEDFASCDLHTLLDKLSGDEKISLLAGPDWWTTNAIPRLGVPSIKCSDGPNGVRGSSHFLPTPANCIPCATALGATFDVDLIHRIGGLLARDAKAKGSSLLLGPTVNLQRNPLNGRAFESFSEDPYLSGMIASAYINGLQEEGVGAVIKHLVCNDMEHERFSVSAEVQERPLREIYLYPFMLAEKYSKPWGVMTAYGRLNGVHCSEDKNLLQGILRDEWGFDGMVMSDWTGTYSTDLAIHAGLDLEMWVNMVWSSLSLILCDRPGPPRFRGLQVKHLINAKKISEKALDARAYAMLQVAQRAVRASIDTVRNNRAPERGRDTPEDRALNRESAAKAIVLLKNTNSVLPLDIKSSNLKRVAIIGPNAKSRTVSGGGSAYLTSAYVITSWDALRGELEQNGIEVAYAPGCYGHRYLPMLDGWIKAEDGSNGWTARFYNEHFDKAPEAVSTLVLPGTRLRINDSKPEGLADDFYLEVSGFILAESTGPYEFGLSLVGRAQLFIDGEMVIDNGMDTPQTPGDSFYGLGTVEEVGVYDLVQGRTYHLTVRYTNYFPPMDSAAVGTSGQPALVMAALRVGGAPKLESKELAIEDAVQLAKKSDAVFCFTGGNMDWEAEGADRKGLGLPGLTDQLVEALLEVKPDTIICNQSGSVFAFPWADKATTLLQSWFGGNETGNGIADVVFGRVNPSGRLPLTIPKRIQDCSAYLNWQAENKKVLYGEGLFVGYRGYDALWREPAFAFGHGLSYSTFEWSSMTATPVHTDDAVSLLVDVSIQVRNTGQAGGAEVVQIYIRDDVCSLKRPEKELKGFAKVYLAVGETKTVHVLLDKGAFSFYDDGAQCWVVERGSFDVLACKSSSKSDLVLTARVELPTTFHWKGV